MRKFTLGVIILALLAAGIVAATYRSYQSATQGSPRGAPVSFTVPVGASLTGLSSELQTMGVIESSRDFHIYLRLSGTSVNLQPGDYRLRRHMPYAQLVSTLAKGPVINYEKVVIPEGLTVTGTAERVAAASHITAADFEAAATTSTVSPAIIAPGISTLEGFLYPQTYFVSPSESAADLVNEMVAQFTTETAGVSWSSAPGGVTPYQVLTIASLIQNEAKAPSDGPMIAAVIYNRLQARMPLQIDATVYYALGRPMSGPPLSKADTRVPSPWNTYVTTGLPPTPISSPRLSSIQAALAPASTNDLYYVLGPDCIHHLFFSSSSAFKQAAARQPTC